MRFGTRRADVMLLVTAALPAVLGWLCVTLGAEVAEGGLTGIDHAVREFARDRHSPLAYAFFDTITVFGSKPLFIVIGMLVAWMISHHSKVLVLLIIVCGVLARVIVHALKEGFGVVRPPLAHALSLSYPSGHVAGAAAIGVVLSYVAWRNERWPRVVTSSCAIMLLLMAMSRVYLDKHWFSDTVGGALIGGAIGLVTCAVYEWTRLRGAGDTRPRAAAVPPASD